MVKNGEKFYGEFGRAIGNFHHFHHFHHEYPPIMMCIMMQLTAFHCVAVQLENIIYYIQDLPVLRQLLFLILTPALLTGTEKCNC